MCDGIDGVVRDDAPAAMPSNGNQYAGLVSRVASLIVDVAVLTVAGIVISVLPTVAWQQVIGRSPGWLATSCGIVAAVFPWVYFTGAWWLTGQTLGGLLLGTAVRRTDGRRVLLIQAASRALIGLAIPPLWLIGLVAVLWDGRRRAWHDVVFRTVVRRVAGPVRHSTTVAVSAESAAAAAPESPAPAAPPAPGFLAGLDERAGEEHERDESLKQPEGIIVPERDGP
ncbi:MAG TPA: RDD family protein [Micromonosporaceae bacterium]|nr:RDD family protein [Micromonosporaceae bacterium]